LCYNYRIKFEIVNNFLLKNYHSLKTMIKKIYVGKISLTTTDQKLFDHFSQVGKVTSATIIKGIDPKKHAGYGYVAMGSDKEMEEAIRKLNNSILDGNHIWVMEAHYIDQEKKQYYYRRY
jgi:RNA recognition motif-containing protein